MRHKVAGYKLGRTTSHRRAMLRNMVTSIIMEERIETTVPKAKAARPHVEKLITLGKRGDLHSRRLVASYLLDPRVVKKLVEQIAPALKDKTGGYTRITKSRVRPGDAAELSFLELVK